MAPTIVFPFLDTGGVNFQIIYNLNTDKMEKNRLFLKSLALELTEPQLINDSQLTTMSPSERQKKCSGGKSHMF